MTTPQLFSWEETQELAKKNKLWRYCVEGCLKQNVFWGLLAIPVMLAFYLIKLIKMSRKIIRYRRITELTNREITELCVKFFDIKENEIMEIKRDYDPLPVIKIKLDDDVWAGIRDPFEVDLFLPKKEKIAFKQWCLAKGVCFYIKENKYLKG